LEKPGAFGIQRGVNAPPTAPARVDRPASGLRWLGFVLLLAGALHLPATARATSVTPPTFAELIAESQFIVRARVQAVRAAWVDSPQGRVIRTYVTVSVLKPLKGAAPAELTLELLCGEIDGHGMQVAGMPRFEPGRMEFLFIAGNGVRFCPLVGIMHGRYRILTDPATAREYVARNDGVPLESEHDVQLPQPGNALALRFKQPAQALSPQTFEQRITGELLRHATRP
jgi:hypothetical protein